jgi:CMP-N-acetylneuraminic acid synthetase
MSEITYSFSIDKKQKLTLIKKIVLKTDDEDIVNRFLNLSEKKINKVPARKLNELEQRIEDVLSEEE